MLLPIRFLAVLLISLFKRFFLEYQLSLSLACLVAITISTQRSFADGSPYVFYVNPSGNGKDGKTLATAWKSPADIDWKAIPSNKNPWRLTNGIPFYLYSIYVTGGTYNESFVVPADKSDITIAPVSQAPAFSGQARYSGPVILQATAANKNGIGIDVGGIYNTVQGFSVSGFQTGIRLKTSNSAIQIKAHNNNIGIVLDGTNSLSYSNIYDNSSANVAWVNVKPDVTMFDPGNDIFVNGCWIHNTRYGAGAGITINQPHGSINDQCTIWSSYLGPGLPYGVHVIGDCQLIHSMCTYVNATNSNIQFDNFTNTSCLTLAQSTLVSFKRNELGTAPNNINMSSTKPEFLSLNNTIIYGGSVKIPLDTPTLSSAANIFFNTTGYKGIPKLMDIDPKFKSGNIYLLSPSTSISTLQSLDFTATAKQANSARGNGDPIVGNWYYNSVSTLMQSCPVPR